MYVVVDNETGQWVTGPLPYSEAASLAYNRPEYTVEETD